MLRYHFLAAVFVLCLPALLHAQYNPLSRRSQLGRQPVGLQPVEVSGTIQGVARNGIVVSNGNNQLWKVAIVAPSKINVGTKLQVTGTATVNNLRSGLIVELSADIDNRNTIQGKFDALTITSITREKPMGVFPDADSGFGGNDADKSVKRSAHAKSGKAGAGRSSEDAESSVGWSSAVAARCRSNPAAARCRSNWPRRPRSASIWPT